MKKKPIVLCLDFGNTRQKAAIFNNHKIEHIVFFNTESLLTDIQNVIEQYQPDISILSSVIYHDVRVETLLKEKTQFFMLNADMQLPIELIQPKGVKMGADRIALAVQAIAKHKNKNNLVIALGTCITYNFINTEKVFLGGSISPGLDMRFKAMHEYTALLPLTSFTHHFPLIGYDTLTHLHSGVILGMAKEIEGIIKEYQNRYNKLSITLTGGNAKYFETLIKIKMNVDEDFLFYGLYEMVRFLTA